jgi:hypothetical protein
MEPDHLREDLKQDVILVVCELPEQRLIELHNKQQLDFFVVRIILNQMKSKTSPFYKNYRREFAELPNEIADKEIPYSEKQQLEKDISTALEQMYWYQADMVRVYAELGNYRAIERATGIPYASCFHTVRKSIKQINAALQ